MVYVIENKDEHLLKNADKQYKKGFFDKINSEKVENISFKTARFKLNSDFRFELVGQGDEELDII